VTGNRTAERERSDPTDGNDREGAKCKRDMNTDTKHSMNDNEMTRVLWKREK